MVVTTQSGKTFLAGHDITCAICTAAEDANKAAETKKKQAPGIVARAFKDYYNRTDCPARELTCGGLSFGKYATLDRAKEVRFQFLQARNEGAQAFTFPEN